MFGKTCKNCAGWGIILCVGLFAGHQASLTYNHNPCPKQLYESPKPPLPVGGDAILVKKHSFGSFLIGAMHKGGRLAPVLYLAVFMSFSLLCVCVCVMLGMEHMLDKCSTIELHP
jgi:hypothetical protein